MKWRLHLLPITLALSGSFALGQTNDTRSDELVRAEALSSQADMGTAQELDARTLLL